MKKAIGLIALLCIVAIFASCGLPDPAKTVDLYFKGISNGESGFAAQVKEEAANEYLSQYPGAEQACNDYITAYLNTFEYQIHDDKTEVDSQAQTARVYVTYSCVDINTLIGEVSASEELVAYAGENYSDFEKVIIFMFELITEKINSGNWTAIEVDATVELSYDSTVKAWMITNENAVFSEIF